MKVAIFGRNPKVESYPVLQVIFDSLLQRGITFFVYEKLYQTLKDQIKFTQVPITFKDEQAFQHEIDFIFSVGGDGTLLNSLPLMSKNQVPILGINIGRLGFLTTVGKDDIYTFLDEIEQKRYNLESRSVLQMNMDNNPFQYANHALNDFVVYRKDAASMIIMHVYLDGSFLNSYWADGLIIATPTGSTGYSLSCGGPIISPESRNFVITPIAPHNLNVRPFVIPDHSIITVEIENRYPSYMVSLDSRAIEMRKQVRFTITKAPFHVQLVRMHNETFLQTLRNKLNWGLDTRNA